MRLEDQVCSLESAKKLKELGAKQDSLFYFALTIDGIKLVTKDLIIDIFGIINEIGKTVETRSIICSAFTVAELGEILQFENTETEDRAKMLIHLLENKLMKS